MFIQLSQPAVSLSPHLFVHLTEKKPAAAPLECTILSEGGCFWGEKGLTRLYNGSDRIQDKNFGTRLSILQILQPVLADRYTVSIK